MSLYRRARQSSLQRRLALTGWRRVGSYASSALIGIGLIWVLVTVVLGWPFIWNAALAGSITGLIWRYWSEERERAQR